MRQDGAFSGVSHGIEGSRPRGLGATEEYAAFEAAKTLEVVMRLLGTLAWWKKEYGCAVQIHLEADDLAKRFDRREELEDTEAVIIGTVGYARQ